jgi:hypothetical protein
VEPAELSVIAGEIIASCTNYPGSWHDSQVAQGIYEKLDTETPDGFSLVADSAFPQGYDRIAGKIRVPLKAGEKLPMDAYLREHAHLLEGGPFLPADRDLGDFVSHWRLKTPMAVPMSSKHVSASTT